MNSHREGVDGVPDMPRETAEGAMPGAARDGWIPEPGRAYRVVKRLMDIAGAATLLVILAPLLVVVSLLIKLTSRGPLAFAQTRLGYHGKPFRILRFRTMYSVVNPDLHKKYVGDLVEGRIRKESDPVFKMTRDPRITPIGKFLRRTSMDELPQFVNVLMGDMSLVGPRPAIDYEFEAYEEWHRQRLSVKPGITGLWQVSGEGRVTFDKMVELDLDYIRHPSIVRDLKILLKTARAVAKGDAGF